MPQENGEIVRRVYEGWARGDFAASREAFDDHVVFVLRRGFPDAGVYVGTDRIAEYTRGFLAPWERIAIDAEDLIEAGDTVVASVHQHGVGAGSGVATGFRYYQVWSLRGGRVIRLENFRERAEALAAAGLRE